MFAAEFGGAAPKPAIKKKVPTGKKIKKKKKKGGAMEFKMPGMGGVLTQKSAASRAAKVTVTKEYDFAGESVKVVKEVDAGSVPCACASAAATHPSLCCHTFARANDLRENMVPTCSRARPVAIQSVSAFSFLFFSFFFSFPPFPPPPLPPF